MPLSLAGRLTLLYAATALVLVAAVTLVQYRTLERSLAREDDHLLLEVLAAATSPTPPPDAGVKPQPGTPGIRRFDRGCRPTRPLAADEPPAECRRGQESPQFRNWRSSGGRDWRIVGQPVDDGDGWVEVALDRSADEGVLEGYREGLGLLLALALLGSVALGFLVSRRGLAPLDRLARRAGGIHARALDQRLEEPDAPAEIRRLTASFDGMLARLDAAFKSLTEFSADLAHELRTPIHILRQQTEVALQRGRTTEEYREVLSASLEELDRLGRMIEDTLFLARTENPQATIERADLDLGTELDSVTEFLGALAEDRGVLLTVEAGPDMRLTADRTLLRRALVNGLTNAIRHTPNGGRVELRAAEEGTTMAVEIVDTGEGISPDDLLRAFDRHFRGRRPGSADSEGAGLGLAIVRSIMHLHGGTATLTSHLGEGTTLRLTFPRKEPSGF